MAHAPSQLGGRLPGHPPKHEWLRTQLLASLPTDRLRPGNARLQLLDQNGAGAALEPMTSPGPPDHQIRLRRKRGLP